MIDLTKLRCMAADPALLSWAVLQEPAMGAGVTQRVGRMGDRFSQGFSTPEMTYESEGRRAIALLQMAQRQGGRVRYRQPGFRVGAPGAPLVNGGHMGGTTLALKALTPRYAVSQGQALNVTVAGRSYLYFAAENAIADAAGNTSVLLTTPMRTFLSGEEAVELARPVIEGWLDGNQRDWSVDTACTVGLKFTVTERA
ncbi:hypothetical protein [Novosphingobium gossypii]|uniref:hypothetical protein n=1 Tax=Novosphingobium gossypii TaxID=1604774 RepID=UPI003D1A4C32